jgi:hypothetical protein
MNTNAAQRLADVDGASLEGQRLQRELADYGKLTRATLRSSRIITDNLPTCKLIADNTGRD